MCVIYLSNLHELLLLQVLSALFVSPPVGSGGLYELYILCQGRQKESKVKLFVSHAAAMFFQCALAARNIVCLVGIFIDARTRFIMQLQHNRSSS